MQRDVDQFVELGYCVVRGAVPPAVAGRVVGHVRDHDRSPPQPWHLVERSVYDLPTLVEAVTAAVRAAFDRLTGSVGWHLAANWGFPVRGPGPLAPLWHIDGDWFRHHVHAGDQVLTPIFLWQDVGENDGPTLLAAGSHQEVARLLAEHEPDGIAGDRIGDVVNQHVQPSRVDAATGRAGDVYVCHPFLAHSVNPVGCARPRFISNVAVHGRGPLRVTAASGPLSPVEVPVAGALDRCGALPAALEDPVADRFD